MSSPSTVPGSRQILRESLLYLLANVATKAAGFLLIPMYSRCLTPAEYGIIELIELTTSVVALIIGLSVSGGAFIRIYYDDTTETWRNSAASTAVLGAVGINVCAAVVAAACSRSISQLVFGNVAYSTLLRATFAGMALGNVIEVCLSYVRVKQRAVSFVAYSLTTLFCTIGLNIYLIAFQRRGVWGFVVSKLIVAGCGCIFLLVTTLRETGVSFHRGAALAMVRFGAPLGLANVSFFVLHFGDRFILARCASLTQVGNYALAYRFGFLVNVLVGEPFGRSWNVAFYRYLGAPDWQERFRRVCLYFSMALIAAGLAISLFADEVMHFVVTPAYYQAFVAVPLLTLAYVIRDIGDFFRNLLYIDKRSGVVAVTGAIAAIANTLLNLLWVPSYGMMGAAWATICSWFVFAIVMCVVAEKQLRVGFPVLGVVVTLALAGLCFVVGESGRSLPIAGQFGMDGLAMILFVALIWRSSLLKPAERVMLLAKVREAAMALRSGRLPRWPASA